MRKLRTLAVAGALLTTVAVGGGIGFAQIHNPPAAAAAEETVTASNAAATTVWDGIFSEDQVARGREAYDEDCVLCHGATLRGTPGAPRIVGSAFRTKWEGQSVAAFIEWLNANMPAGRAGSLSMQTYADLAALILEGNGYPAGEAELIPGDEALQNIVFTPQAE